MALSEPDFSGLTIDDIETGTTFAGSVFTSVCNVCRTFQYGYGVLETGHHYPCRPCGCGKPVNGPKRFRIGIPPESKRVWDCSCLDMKDEDVQKRVASKICDKIYTFNKSDLPEFSRMIRHCYPFINTVLVRAHITRRLSDLNMQKYSRKVFEDQAAKYQKLQTVLDECSVKYAVVKPALRK